MSLPPVTLEFSQGTLLLKGTDEQLSDVAGMIVYDKRVNLYRASAYKYAAIVLKLREKHINFTDNAKDFVPCELKFSSALNPRKHQSEALRCWKESSGRAIIVMPTGSGKTYLAAMVLHYLRRPALIVVPTIDLMQQWAGVLERLFGCRVGMLGGGVKEVDLLTVTTYDSAVLNMEFIGNRFGLVIFDECHHLPGAVNRTAASMCMAPYRLGLTATPECDEECLSVLKELIGPVAFQIHIDELEGSVLAPYLTRRVEVKLDSQELSEYERNRNIYTDFIRRNNITFSRKNDWARFLGLCVREPGGRVVLDAYLNQRRLARASKSKFIKVWELLRRHRNERVIIFTADNQTAYELGQQFFLPVLTHHTKANERKEFLDKFRSGEYPILITSKVLNEGVDVPEAGIGIVFSGSGSIREHVQRLGRILRAGDGKKAILYELVSEGTSEVYVSQRRREHRAYQRRTHTNRGRIDAN